MKTIRPDKPEPIPARAQPHGIGKIIIRFVALLVIIVGLMVLAWLR